MPPLSGVTLPQSLYLNFLLYKTRTITTSCIFQGCVGHEWSIRRGSALNAGAAEHTMSRREQLLCQPAHTSRGQTGQEEERLRVMEHSQRRRRTAWTRPRHGEAKPSQEQEHCHSPSPQAGPGSQTWVFCH